MGTVMIRLSPERGGRGVIETSTFKRGGLFKSQENTLQKDLRNALNPGGTSI